MFYILIEEGSSESVSDFEDEEEKKKGDGSK